MSNPFFDDLIQSVREAVEISKGNMQPARVTVVSRPDLTDNHCGERQPATVDDSAQKID